MERAEELVWTGSHQAGIGERLGAERASSLAPLPLKLQHELGVLLAEADYVETLGLTLKAGRDFDSERPSDETGTYLLISLVVMRERGITDALTADRHFEQAGFNALLGTLWTG